jgi:hypothetical protein
MPEIRIIEQRQHLDRIQLEMPPEQRRRLLARLREEMEQAIEKAARELPSARLVWSLYEETEDLRTNARFRGVELHVAHRYEVE